MKVTIFPIVMNNNIEPLFRGFIFCFSYVMILSEDRKMRKQIFIVSQHGVEPEYLRCVKEAAEEFMSMFPQYKDDYPIRLLGQWRDRDYKVDRMGYSRLPPEEKRKCIPMTTGEYMRPYKSTDWAMAEAKRSAFKVDRPNQIDAMKLLDLMNEDPTVSSIPQININIVKDDAVVVDENGRPNNFVYGMGRGDSGLVLSLKRLKDRYGHNPEYLKEVIKTLTIHELGHVFSATRDGRHNVANRDGYGAHCDCPDCVMRTDSRADSKKLTDDRLRRKREGKPPLCPECISSAEVTFAYLRGNSQELDGAIKKFNYIKDRSETYS